MCWIFSFVLNELRKKSGGGVVSAKNIIGQHIPGRIFKKVDL